MKMRPWLFKLTLVGFCYLGAGAAFGLGSSPQSCGKFVTKPAATPRIHRFDAIAAYSSPGGAEEGLRWENMKATLRIVVAACVFLLVACSSSPQSLILGRW